MKKARRRGKSAHPSTLVTRELVPLSCPDCSGVLSFEEEGAHEYRIYVCQIDHRYSMRSLVQAKEAQLERVLWPANVLLKQLLFVYQEAVSAMKHWTPAERKSDYLSSTTELDSIRVRVKETRKV